MYYDLIRSAFALARRLNPHSRAEDVSFFLMGWVALVQCFNVLTIMALFQWSESYRELFSDWAKPVIAGLYFAFLFCNVRAASRAIGYRAIDQGLISADRKQLAEMSGIAVTYVVLSPIAFVVVHVLMQIIRFEF